MKTREIDVWVKKQGILDNNTNIDTRQRQYFAPLSGSYVKAKLIIEPPEPKIEVTPSIIKESVNKMWGRYSFVNDFSNELNKVLFGEDYE